MSGLPLYNKEPPAMTQRRPETHTPSRHRQLTFLGILLALSWATYMLHCGSGAIHRIPLMATQNPHPDVAQPLDPSPLIPTTAEPNSRDLIKLMDLPSNYLPKTGKNRVGARLIVVGDVHGMKESLESLLEKVKFNTEHDHLILAGDMISKGPDSKGVVDLAMKLGATGVRGNHEDRVLSAYKKMRKNDDDNTAESDEVEFIEGSENETETVIAEGDDDGDVETAGKRKKDRKLIKQLGKNRLKWLEQCPVILRVGNLGKMGEVVVVHAGLAPGVELKKQKPELVMNMRTIGDDGVPRDDHKGTPWIKPWNKLQKSLSKKDRTSAIYGHDSRRGLRIKKYSMGIDTGCVRGGKLTAMVIEGGHFHHSYKIVQVSCKR